MSTVPITPLILVPAPEPAAARGPSLRDLEETLQALLDCEETVTAEQEAEYRADIQAALAASVSKRDRYHRHLLHRERQIAEAKAYLGTLKDEEARVKDRIAVLENKLEREENYVLRVIQSLGDPDPSGKYPQVLEGTVVTFRAQKNPPSVSDAFDVPKIPAKYKTTEVKMPTPLWDEINESLPMDLLCQVTESVRPKVEIAKGLIKADLTAKPAVDVPGANLNAVSYRLVRK